MTCHLHAVVVLPVRLALTAGEARDNRLAEKLLSRLKSGTMLLASVAMTPIGSEPLFASTVPGRISHPKEIAQRGVLRPLLSGPILFADKIP